MTGHLRAERAAWRAVRRVPDIAPTYRHRGIAVDRLGAQRNPGRNFRSRQHSYVDAYPLAQRCLDGRIPSSARRSTNPALDRNALQWIRSEADAISRTAHQLLSRAIACTEPLSRSMPSPWALGDRLQHDVGVNHNGDRQSTGPDIGKILSTMRFSERISIPDLGFHRREAFVGRRCCRSHALERLSQAGDGGGEGMT